MMNRRHFLLAGLSLLGVAACGRNEPIHQPTPLTSITPKVKLSRSWQLSLGSMGRRDVPGLSIVENDGRILAAAGNGGVACLNLEGKMLWQKSLSVPLTAGPALSPVAEVLYVGSAKGDVFALHEKTGESKWHIAVNTEVLSVSTGSGRVFVRTGEGKLMALDAMDGKQLWVIDHDMPSLSVRGMAKPVAVANAMVLGWEDGFVETILQVNGERVWESRIALPRGRTEIERMVDVQSTVLTDGDRVFAGATNQKIVALDLQSGNPLWQNDTATWVDMALGQNRLLVVAGDDTVKAISTESGRVLWQQTALKYRRLTKAIAWGDWMVAADMEGVMHLLNGQDGSLIGRAEGAVQTALVDALALTDRRLLTLDVAGNLSLWQASGVEV